MGGHSPCPECQSILEELRSALAEFRSSARSGDTLPGAFEAVRDLFGGTEESAQRAEQVLRRFRPRLGGPDPEYRPNRVGEIIHKMQDHRARTGHSVLPGF